MIGKRFDTTQVTAKLVDVTVMVALVLDAHPQVWPRQIEQKPVGAEIEHWLWQTHTS